MSTSEPSIEKSIRAYLRPRLKEDGFSGSGRTFCKLSNGIIQVLNVQGSRYGGQFAINLGIHPIAIPDVLGNTPNPKTIKESLCEFRRRLSKSGSDQWWTHDATEQGMNLAVAAAAEVYVQVARPLFAIMCGNESPIYSITPEQMPIFRECFRGFGSTDVRIALVIAKLRKTQGKMMDSQAFAAYGLAHLGRPNSLTAELEKLSQGA